MTTKNMFSIAFAVVLSAPVAAARIESDLVFERDADDLIPTTLVTTKAAPAAGTTLKSQPVSFS